MKSDLQMSRFHRQYDQSPRKTNENIFSGKKTCRARTLKLHGARTQGLYNS